MKHVTIYTDGACSGNPGPGGWGAVLIYDTINQLETSTEQGEARSVGESDARGRITPSHIKDLSGGEADTTNNRMEMMAAIQALRALKAPCQVTLFTDSTYVLKGITEWLPGWKARGWKTADKKPVKNADLWQELEAETMRHHMVWKWVKGHDGDEMNERADQLAVKAVPR